MLTLTTRFTSRLLALGAPLIIILAFHVAAGVEPSHPNSAIREAVAAVEAAAARSPARPGFERVQQLEGSWIGTSTTGKHVNLTYYLVSNGTCVLEAYTHDHEGGVFKIKDMPMMTMYHLDGERLMMTHYCTLGSQPRMVADRVHVKDASDVKGLLFRLRDATNLVTPEILHMSGLEFQFDDNDHFKQIWLSCCHGRPEVTETFTFRRRTKDDVNPPAKSAHPASPSK